MEANEAMKKDKRLPIPLMLEASLQEYPGNAVDTCMAAFMTSDVVHI